MKKVWLIETMAPFVGTETYYKVYSEECPDLNDWFYDEEVYRLYDDFGYLDDWKASFEEDSEGFDDFDEYSECRMNNWIYDCSMTITESTEEECENHGAELLEI